jgi:hypothetical protein
MFWLGVLFLDCAAWTRPVGKRFQELRMMPENFFFGGGSTSTNFSILGAIMILIAIAFMLVLPRKYVLIPALLAIFLVPMGQSLVVAGAHLMPDRIIALFGWVRLCFIKFSSGEDLFAGRLNAIDGIFSFWAIFHVLAFTLLWMNTSALFNQFGFLWSSFGMYFLLRYLIKDDEDVLTIIKVFAVIMAINAVEMIYEQMMHQNFFRSHIGGVQGSLLIRDGKVRSQGAFGHPILAGTCAATLLPLFLILWKDEKAKILGIVGIVSSTVMVFTSASSTPVLTYLAGMIAICFWPLREKMHLVRWGIVLSLAGLHLVMNSPVWWIIKYMDVIGASSGYHRAAIVDLFIRNFSEWWLVGTKDFGNWGWSMWDLANNYVAEGETGGLLALIAFISMIYYSFSRLGRARNALVHDRYQEWYLWLLCAALFAHIIGFFGISYWDQTQVAWFTLLAIISAATATRLPRSGEVDENGAPIPELDSPVGI